ncbi:hypothetical protein PG984_015365 [Apiospora sp. TS-2023a]
MASPIVTAAQPTTTMSGSSLFDLLFGLPVELFDLVIEKLPVEDQVAFSITCHAARRIMLRSHLRDLDWISFRHERDWPNWLKRCYSGHGSCQEFLQNHLAKDLVDRFVYCSWIKTHEAGAHLTLVAEHELVVHGNGTSSAKRAVRKYLDSTPYWLCPHLRTHAVGNASDRGMHCGPGVQPHICQDDHYCDFIQLFPGKGKASPPPSNELCRIPCLNLDKAVAEWDCADRPTDPVFDPTMNGQVWLHCNFCLANWSMETRWLARPDKHLPNDLVGGEDEGGTVCLSFTRSWILDDEYI